MMASNILILPQLAATYAYELPEQQFLLVAGGRPPATDWLQQAGYNPQAVTVEYNDRILPKDGYDSTILQDGDVVEIVCFMGGG